MSRETAERIANRLLVTKPRWAEFRGKSIFGHVVVFAGAGHGDIVYAWRPTQEEAILVKEEMKPFTAKNLEGWNLLQGGRA